MHRPAGRLSLDADFRHAPGAVLVFPAVSGCSLWVRHPARGWEPPGGKLEPGETPEDAARREVWEETGATLRSLHWIAEYWVPDHQAYKWVYAAVVEDWHARPPGGEIVDVLLMPGLPAPDAVRASAHASFILKDAVYERVHPILLRHLQASK
ncbi:NUDIX domain-containing protein [Alicyclobacillus sp.]|uniref:NUDIX domain-containing protein n=1 Tax=Alicyclobacillus sp. TaxID=61169 RepID=UPI0025C40881|nr:NUDIX domain-containing protein [Alicyclobacillus sp.]MCL6515426.1 NUDIX domain-containing protein [Alicyclobacillus sp.]